MNKLKKAVAACHTGPTLKPVSLLKTIRDTGYWLFLSPISFLVYIEREREGKHVLEIICGTRFSLSTVCAIAQTQVGRLGGKHLHPPCHFVSTPLFSYCTCDAIFVSMKGGWAKKTVPGWRKSSSENPSHAEEWNCQCPAKPHHSWRVLQEPHITTTKSLGTFIPPFFFFSVFILWLPLSDAASSPLSDILDDHLKNEAEAWWSLSWVMMDKGQPRSYPQAIGSIS